MTAFLLLAQEIVGPRPGQIAPEEAILYFIVFLATVIFVATGYSLFSVGWESYEEKYIQGAERSLNDLLITIPPQQLLWLSVFGLFFGFGVGMILFENVVMGFVFSILGTMAPRTTLKIMKSKRDEKFKEQLVESLITLTNALRSGFSLPKAFQLIAHDMPKPICQEFAILVQELRLGIDIEDGFANMLKRMPSEDLDLVVTSVSISNAVGGNLAEVFDKIGETIRERRRIEGRIDSLTAQGKMQGIVTALLPVFVAVMINWIEPEIMKPLYTTWWGYGIIALMCVMSAVGYFFIRKIVNIEV